LLAFRMAGSAKSIMIFELHSRNWNDQPK
jgi:hypothetical protein